MARDKSEKKEKKSKDVSETIAEDVEMADVEVVKVYLIVHDMLCGILNHSVGRKALQEGEGGDYHSSRRPLTYCAPARTEETPEEAPQDYQEGYVARVSS